MEGGKEWRMKIEEELNQLRKRVDDLQTELHNKKNIEEGFKQLKNQVQDLLTDNKGKIPFKSAKIVKQTQASCPPNKRLCPDSKVRKSILLPVVFFEDFKLSKQFETCKKEVLQYIFSDADSSEVLAKTDSCWLKRYDFRYLGPGSQLEIEIFAMVSSLLTAKERASKVDKLNWYLPARLLKDQLPYSSKSELGKVWSDVNYVAGYMGKLENCNEIFIPVLYNKHYLLCRVMIKKQTVEVWDSLAKYDDPIMYKYPIVDILRALDYVLDEQIKVRPITISFGSFKITRASNVPRQPNTFDCGVFVILFMMNACKIKSSSFVFNSDDERCRIASWIACSDLNQKLPDLQRAIMPHLS